MSWAEVKKMNSDLSTPINIANLINHIDMVGDNYKGRYDLDLTKQLLRADGIYSHLIALDTVASDFWDYVLNISGNVGVDIDGAFNLNSPIIASYQTVASLMASPEAMFELFKNDKVTTSLMIPQNQTPFASLITGQGAMSGLLNSSVATTLLTNDSLDRLYAGTIRSRTVANSEINNANNLSVITTLGSGNYVVPAGVYNLFVATISGGGSGGRLRQIGGDGGGGGGIGSGSNTAGYGGGGGGGGAIRLHTLKVTPGQIIPFFVADGGILTGDITSGVKQPNGGTTLFNGLLGVKQTLQSKVLATSSDGGGAFAGMQGISGALGGGGGVMVTSGYGGGGGGGWGGGNGQASDGTGAGAGGGGFGGGGGGVPTGKSNTYSGGTGGLTYGNIGGGSRGSDVNNNPVARGGQGCIAIYTGRQTL